MSVDILARMALQLEAVKKQQTDDQNRNTRLGKERKPFPRPGDTDREEFKTNARCHRCGRVGHKAFQCTIDISREKNPIKPEEPSIRLGINPNRDNGRGLARNNLQTSVPATDTSNTTTFNTCFRCGKPGHSTRDCKQVKYEPRREIRVVKRLTRRPDKKKTSANNYKRVEERSKDDKPNRNQDENANV
ncbi:MAG: hypothetical protein ACRDF4_05390, partial [Rhabdochlamydiaceae bacterium]